MLETNTTTTAGTNESDLKKYTDEAHPTRTTKNTYVKPGPDIEWNNKDAEAYIAIGLRPPEHLGRFQKRFLSLVQGQIEKTITHMVRLKAFDYLEFEDNNGKEQQKGKKGLPERKEYLYWTERLEGV